jgi:hypothetical protein
MLSEIYLFVLCLPSLVIYPPKSMRKVLICGMPNISSLKVEEKSKMLKEALTAEDYCSDQKCHKICSSCDVEQPYLSLPLQVEFKEKNPSKLTGEVVDKPASRPNIFLRNPSISAEILSSSWKAEREIERESVFQAFRIVPTVSLSLPWLLVKQPFEARFMWHQHLCRAESGRRQPLLFFFSAGKKMGHRRTEVAL